MKKLTEKEIEHKLIQHEKWLSNKNNIPTNKVKSNLKPADFSNKDLRGVDFSHKKLIGANFEGADLSYANLSFSDFSNCNFKKACFLYGNLNTSEFNYANFEGADVRSANISSSDFCRTNLKDADFSDSLLIGSNFSDTKLENINLRDADLRFSKIYDINLEKIIVSEGTVGIDLECPEEGSFIGYKTADDKIIVLEIPADAERYSATTKKCRCSKAKVLHIEELDGSISKVKCVKSDWDENFIYELGKTVSVSNFDRNRWNECSTGIHFFMNKIMAKQYKH